MQSGGEQIAVIDLIPFLLPSSHPSRNAPPHYTARSLLLRLIGLCPHHPDRGGPHSAHIRVTTEPRKANSTNICSKTFLSSTSTCPCHSMLSQVNGRERLYVTDRTYKYTYVTSPFPPAFKFWTCSLLLPSCPFSSSCFA